MDEGLSPVEERGQGTGDHSSPGTFPRPVFRLGALLQAAQGSENAAGLDALEVLRWELISLWA